MRPYVLIFLSALLIGCPHKTLEYRKFNGYADAITIEGNRRGFQRHEGPNTLLEIYKFSGAGCLIPMAWEGYSLFIEIPQDMIAKNATISMQDNNIMRLCTKPK